MISGSVAVNRLGARVGKGGGFADLEYGLAIAAGIISPQTPVISTVHPIQVLEEKLPCTHHDVFPGLCGHRRGGHPLHRGDAPSHRHLLGGPHAG